MSFQRIRIILLAAFCVSLLIIVANFIIRPQAESERKPVAETPTASNADLTIQSIRMVENQGGRTEWELEAESSETFQKENLTILKNVKAKFYPEGHPVVYVKGREGRLWTETKNMIIRGDVVVQSDGGYALKTEELRYDSAKRRVDTDEPIELSQQGLTVRGVGLTANIDGKTLTVRREVKATFQ